MVTGDLLVSEQVAAQATTGDLAILVAPRTRRASGHTSHVLLRGPLTGRVVTALATVLAWPGQTLLALDVINRSSQGAH
jgi:hypothetical protein